jgi:hypothetical protein
MSPSLYTYEGQCARLDTTYVERIGRTVSDQLASCGEAVAVQYEPDNGTSYHLVFVPVGGIYQLSEWRVPSGVEYDPDRRWCLVVKTNGTDSDWVYPFNLTPGWTHECGYVGSKTGTNVADASAITALLRAICGVEIV